jgi:hypothetical protein
VRIVLFCLAVALVRAPVMKGQQAAPPATTNQNSPTMKSAAGMHHMQGDAAGTSQSPFLALLQQHTTAGTDVEPESTPGGMMMRSEGKWMLMLHGVAFLNEIQQSGPRGSGKFFSTNWLMPMAQRKMGKGTLTLRTMLSLEPATVTGRLYPELFQQGETAYGRPIVDGQHPHDFFMELAAMYDYQWSRNSLLSIYAAPVGDPALGPVAYPHRASASEDPLAPLGHHLQDSTHIAEDVVTFGFAYRRIRLEASGFHGREPDESRWNIGSGKLDSWSTRISFNPGRNWSWQYSLAQLHSPEALSPDDDTRRMTSSLMYNRPLARGNWAALLLWGRNQSLTDGNVGNGYLAESTLRFFGRNYVWMRLENVDRTNELLLGGSALPPGFTERYFARVAAYTFGYDREFSHLPHLATAVGGQMTFYGVPEALQSTYGTHPVGVDLFLRLRLR